jgi:uncharacterized iron-regulated membrane protein
MAWVHTWFGLVLGFLLIVIFFFGSLSVFDREIDRWVLPETRFEPQIMPSYEGILEQAFNHVAPETDELAAAKMRVEGELPEQLQIMNWGAYTTHRDPTLYLYAEYAVPNNPNDPFDHIHGYATIDPRTGAFLPKDHLKIGSEFFYPMHYRLYLHWENLGYIIVGVAALIMLVALVSGVIIHRKLFREFFTFRRHKHTQRRVLDLHNMTGVVALPFHFFFAFSGLVIFAYIYLPVSATVLQTPAFAAAQEEAKDKGLAFAPAGQSAAIASVDTMVVAAKRLWSERGMPGDVGYLFVNHPGDINSYVSIYRAGRDAVSLVGQGIHFNSVTGELIYQDPDPTAISIINEFLTGLHLQHFEHWLLRWLYVIGGLMGCICIATGFIFFVEKRKRDSQQVTTVRWVDAFAVTSITGMLLATMAILVANRLLPVDLEHKGSWEIRAFFMVWLLSLGHAFWRSNIVAQGLISPAWREQCWGVALLSVLAVLLNWTTTGDHLLKTLFNGYWPVASMDLVLLTLSGLSIKVALSLRQREGDALLLMEQG